MAFTRDVVVITGETHEIRTREIPRVATRGHACKNEVVIELYRSCITNTHDT